LLQLLTEGVDRSQVSKIFENVTFVVFNYDRCLEHFLAEALAAYYVDRLDDMRRVVANAKFIHPYGTVGELGWFGSMGPSFGAEVSGEKLLQIAGGLKTFTEQFTDEVLQAKLQTEIERARTVVFLGFAFHEQNMKLLAPKQKSDAKRIFATAYAVSQSDCEVIIGNILATLQTKPAHTSVEIRNDLKCAGLFEQYWRSLRAS
ncbi:MAG TPA: SIR2 family protein, partial [Rhizomicrobium sp.]|nr:SIR2 family protein [Rhizomicrobium sp.]